MPTVSTAAAAPTRVQPASETAREFWRFAGKPDGDALGLVGKQAAESRGRSVTPSGLRYRIDSFPDLRSLVEGSQVSLGLPDGRILPGIVNYSRRDEGYEDTHQVSIGFKGDKGGLVVIHDATNGHVQGQLLVEGDKMAWTVEPDGKGVLWLVEHLREDLVCELPNSPTPNEPAAPAGASAAAARSYPLPGDSTVTGSGAVPPKLNSRSSATAVLYLDFNGEATTTYPNWPDSNPGGVPIAAPHSGLTADQMTAVWRRVAEDYIQFNINVSTELAKYNAVSAGERMRIIISQTLKGSLSGAGVAKMQSFRRNNVSGYAFDSKVPAWMPVTPNYSDNTSTMTDAQLSSLASNITHEFGHTLALWHDGNDGTQPTDQNAGNYYDGHGTEPFDWSPVMGSPYRTGSDARGMIQWAKKQYPGANNSQDDLAILSGTINGFGYATDESNGYIDATLLTTTGTNQVGGGGTVATSSDLDWWVFTVKFAGNTTIEVAPADTSVSLPNLDCGFRIEDILGNTVAGGFAPENDLVAKATVNLAPGNYHVVAYGTGNKTFSTGGYNDYGSTGRYLVTVDLPPDTVDPVPVIQSPVAGVLGSTSLQFNGTATDNDRVSGFSIFLRRNADNAYWNGSYWQIGTWALSQNFNSTAPAWNCTASLPQVGGSGPGSLNAGSYDFIAIAEDPAGHSKQATTTVTVDSSGPTVAISSSTVTLGSSGYAFNGTSQDPGGVQAVNCFIRRDSDGQYWNGSGWGAPAINLPTNHVSHTTSQQRPWSCVSTLPQPAAQLTQGTYTFIAITTDQIGNHTQADSVVLIDDNQPPQVTVTTPSQNSFVSTLGSISGTATDLSGIQAGSVTLTLYQNSTGKFWNGSDWVGTIATLHATSSGNNWSYNSVPSGSKLTTGEYFISVHALDNAGTLSAAVPGLNQTSFQVDQSPPTISIATPANGATIASLPSVSGSAADSNDISTVRLYLYRYSDGKFWDGSSWGGGGSAILPTHASGGSWSSLAGALPTPGTNENTNLTSGSYDIIAYAVDTAGNQTRADSVVSVEIIYTWTGITGNNLWDDSSNWSVNGSLSFSVPGPDDAVIIGGGSPTLPGGSPRQIHKLTMTGGIFNQGELTVTGTFDWTGGQIWGKINVPIGAALNISGPEPKYVIGYGVYGYGNIHAPGILNNLGTATWTGTGEIQMQWQTASGGAFYNFGSFDIQTDAKMSNYNGGGFVNTGSVDKTAGTGATRMELVVTNNGTMRADSGRIVFAGGGGASAGEYALTSVNCFEWAGGTHTFGPGARLTGSGQALISGGVVQGGPAASVPLDIANAATLALSTGGNLSKNLTFTGGGSFLWTGGGISGTLEIGPAMHMALTGPDLKFLEAYGYYGYGYTDSRGTIQNAGTATWDGAGSLQLQWGSRFFNTGSLTINSDAILNDFNGGSFINSGLLRKAGGTGASEISAVVFSNPGGTLDIQTGVLKLENSISHTIATGSQLTGAGRLLVEAGTLTISGTLGGTGHLELAATGVLDGTHALSASTLHWTGGTIVGNTTVAPAGFLEISGSVVKVLNGYGMYGYGNTAQPGILINKGTGTWTGSGDISIQWATTVGGIQSSTFTNEGTMTIQTDADMTAFNGGRFVNTGTLAKDLSNGVTRFDVSLSNQGTLFCRSGKVQINAGGASSGRFDMPVANSLEFTGGTSVLAHGTSFTSSGRGRITGGIVAFANTIPNDVTLGTGSGIELATGGTLARDGSFVGSGTFQFTGGAIIGTTNFNGTTVLEVNGPDLKFLDAYGSYGYGQADGRGTVNVNSSAIWDGTGGIRLQWGSVLRINGLMDLRSDAVMDQYNGGLFQNTGTLRKSSGTGVSSIAGVALNNSGVLDLQTGVLGLNGTHSLNPGTSLTGLGRLRTDGGSLTVTGTVTGAGHFEHAAGVLAGTHTFAAATMHWTGGEIAGITTVGPAAVLEISGSAPKYIQGYNLYGYGNAAAPGILNNQGLATWTGTGEIQTQWASGNGARFNNSGTFRVQTSALFSQYAGGSFVNSGNLVVGASVGIFNINAGFEQTSTGAMNVEIGGNSDTQFDRVVCGGGAGLAGTMNVSLINGFVPVAGSTYSLMTFNSRSGTFDTLKSPGTIWGRQYNPNNLTLVAKTYPTTAAEWAAYFFTDSNSLDAQMSADPDKDGLPNLLEYALGSDPHAGGATGITAGKVVIGSDTYLTLVFTRPAGTAALTDVTYIGERSTNLGGWSAAGAVVQSVVPGPGDAKETVTLRSVQPIAGAAKDFLHLKATVGN